jgi:hypothetical protein
MRIVEPIESVKRDFHGVTLEIARAHSAAHIAKTRVAVDKIRGDRPETELTAADYRQINAEAIPGTVLVGWGGFVIDGAEVPFSEANGQSLLEDDDFAYEFIMKHAMDQDQFLARVNEDSKKKFSQVSNGN